MRRSDHQVVTITGVTDSMVGRASQLIGTGHFTASSATKCMAQTPTPVTSAASAFQRWRPAASW